MLCGNLGASDDLPFVTNIWELQVCRTNLKSEQTARNTVTTTIIIIIIITITTTTTTTTIKFSFHSPRDEGMQEE
jgi:hypothetical protein